MFKYPAKIQFYIGMPKCEYHAVHKADAVAFRKKDRTGLERRPVPAEP